MSEKNNKQNNEYIEKDSRDEDNSDLDIEFEETEYEGVRQNDKLKKLRQELSEVKKQAQEYLTGWQKERASFANYKAEEEKKRSERLAFQKVQLISDFLPVLDSFDMAFGNKETWEKVDPAWRTGVEYIYSQFMNTLQQYNVEVIDKVDVDFNPMFHDPIEHIEVESEDKDNMILSMIQKGYRSGDTILRPAKVKVGKYEDAGN